HPLPVALLESVENEKSGVDVPRVDHVVELVLIDRELLHIARQEVAVLGIEELQVALEYLPGEGIVDGLTAVVRLLEDPADLARDRALLVGRRQRAGGRDRRGPRGSAQGEIRGGEHENREDGEGEPSERTAEGLEHLEVLVGPWENGESSGAHSIAESFLGHLRFRSRVISGFLAFRARIRRDLNPWA